jgi:hypothetical protein
VSRVEASECESHAGYVICNNLIRSAESFLSIKEKILAMYEDLQEKKRPKNSLEVPSLSASNGLSSQIPLD